MVGTECILAGTESYNRAHGICAQWMVSHRTNTIGTHTLFKERQRAC